MAPARDSPAQHIAARMGVDAGAAAIFPDAGIGLQRQGGALPRHLLDQAEQAARRPGCGRRLSKNIGTADRITLP